MFSNLIGNDLAKQTLSRIVQTKMIPHAMIFAGPSGVGKNKFAIELAKGILGSAHARKIDAGHHPDLRIFSPEGKTGMHSIASIHQLQSQMALEPFEANCRVFIVDQADKMLPTSSNALLKTLEEPEARNYFILITQQIDEIIPTIQSRCRKITFFPIPELQICDFLIQTHNLSPEQAKKNAFLSHGSLEKALLIKNQPEDARRNLLLEILVDGRFNSIKHAENISSIEQLLMQSYQEEQINQYFAEIDALFEEIFYWFRDIHLLKMGVEERLVFHSDSIPLLKQKISVDVLSMEKVGKYIEEAQLAVHRSIKVKTVLEYLLSQLLAKA